jgi:hypothetical protein
VLAIGPCSCGRTQALARNPADIFKKRLPKVERQEMVTLAAEQSATLSRAFAHTRLYWPVLLEHPAAMLNRM